MRLTRAAVVSMERERRVLYRLPPFLREPLFLPVAPRRQETGLPTRILQPRQQGDQGDCDVEPELGTGSHGGDPGMACPDGFSSQTCTGTDLKSRPEPASFPANSLAR
jgi:hypothetical protein